MLTKTTVNQPRIQHKQALPYLIQDEQNLWQVCLIKTLQLQQLSSSFQRDGGLGTESPPSRVRLYTEHCGAAEGEGRAGAEAAGWDGLRDCTMVTFCRLCPRCLWLPADFIAGVIYKKEASSSTLRLLNPIFLLILHLAISIFWSKIMGAIILLLLNISQASWLTIKNPLVSHWPPTKASFLTHLWITVGTETLNLFLCTQDLKAEISLVQQKYGSLMWLGADRSIGRAARYLTPMKWNVQQQKKILI